MEDILLSLESKLPPEENLLEFLGGEECLDVLECHTNSALSKWIPAKTPMMIIFTNLNAAVHRLTTQSIPWRPVVEALMASCLRSYTAHRKTVLEKLERNELPMPSRGWDIQDLRTIKIMVTHCSPTFFASQKTLLLAPFQEYPLKDEEEWLTVAGSHCRIPIAVSWPLSRLLWLTFKKDEEESPLVLLPAELLQLLSLLLDELYVSTICAFD
jgi:hypothetical protein